MIEQPSIPVVQPVEIQLAVINTKLDTLLIQRDDHESRLRKLEQFKWLLLGAAVASGGVGASIAQMLQ